MPPIDRLILKTPSDGRSSTLAVERLRGALAGRADAALLECSAAFGETSRYGLYAAFPRAVFEIVDGRWSLSEDWPGERPPADGDAWSALRHLLRQTHRPILEASAGAAPFQGGWIGYLGYDLAPLVERVPRRHPRAGVLPDARLSYYDAFVLVDLVDGTETLETTDAFGEGEAARRRRRDQLAELLVDAVEPPHVAGPLVSRPPTSDFAPEDYEKAVERILEYLRAGDIFQANFTHRFSAPFLGGVTELVRRSAARNPAPFAAVLGGPTWAVVSSSPERFLLVEPDGRVETRPIKGTRPRGRTPFHDLSLAWALTSDPKDMAELTMIVDLERNDLGRVASYGSVKVLRHAAIESFASVHHLVSTVEAKLRPDCDLVDLLKASFPGGSITGAPKIRAMEIIDELERCRRGVYTGGVGYVSDHGRADFNIAIRTLVVEGLPASGRDVPLPPEAGAVVHYHVGGGIVVDSDPRAEYRETLAKGARMRDVLLGTMEDGAGGGPS
ncbi:MAG: aminodeoxychorismate synthase component I [Planctomycetia bacterium]